MPGYISLKDVVLRAVHPGSDHTRDVQNMIYTCKNIVDVQDYDYQC